MKHIIKTLLLLLIISSCSFAEPVRQARTSLKGLPLDEFIEESYTQILSRYPETVTEIGMDQSWGLDGTALNDYSREYEAQTLALLEEVLRQLLLFSEEGLSFDQRSHYRVYRWLLEDMIEEYRHKTFQYRVHHFIVGEPQNTELFFSEIQPMNSAMDAQAYVDRLWEVDRKFHDLAQAMERQTDGGITLPSLSIDWTLGHIMEVLNGSMEDSPYYGSFQEKLMALELSEEDEATLLSQAAQAYEESVMPGYRRLEQALKQQREMEGHMEGVGRYPGGEEYYQFCLRHHITLDISPQEIHQQGQQSLISIRREMDRRFEDLGLDSSLSLAELYQELAQMDRAVPSEEVIPQYELLLDRAFQECKDLFYEMPKNPVELRGVQNGGYYVPGLPDEGRPGVFFASNTRSLPRFSMATLLFHETVPGHHFQITHSQEEDLPPFRQSAEFLGYVEGWALYGELLMAESGFYSNDPAGDLGRLQAQAHRAARMVMDTGLHYYGWTFDQAADYFVEKTGLSRGYGQWEALRYLVWPGQAPAYLAGQQRLLEFRKQFLERAGESFDVRDYHQWLLQRGSTPLEVLEGELFEDLSGQALVLIDIQEAFLPVHQQGQLIRNALELRNRADEAGIPVIYVYQTDSSVPSGSDRWQFPAALKPRPEDYIIEKTSPSAFTDTPLNQVLWNLEVNHLVAVGISTPHCYSATISHGLRLGYDFTVVSDGHSTTGQGASGVVESYNERFASWQGVELQSSGELIFTGD